MKINLISNSNNIVDIIYTAIRTCTSEQPPINIFNYLLTERETKLCLIKKVISSGHLSVLRHINFTFSIEGISRACANQLVRHTAGFAFSQQSMRYVQFKFNDDFKVEDYFLVPKNLSEDEKIIYRIECLKSIQSYEKLINEGFKVEDARGVLGLNFKTNLLVTCNLQALIHLANERLCKRSQAEIQDLVFIMCEEASKNDVWLLEYLQPKCIKNGSCKEINKCQKK